MQNFIKEYLVSGPIVFESDKLRKQDLSSNKEYKDQFDLEKYLRKAIVDKPMKILNQNIKLGEKSEIGLRWQYHYDYDNWFVDFSNFYLELKQVEMIAVTSIKAEQACKINIVLWSYAAVGLWCNKMYVGGIDTPAYKPIQKQELELNLEAGYNEIFIRVQNLGVRDTRTIFGVEIKDDDTVKAELSNKYGDLSEIREARKWLDSLNLDLDKIKSKSSAPKSTFLSYGGFKFNFADVKKEELSKEITNLREIYLEPNNPYVNITCKVLGNKLTRRFEKITDIKPIYTNKKTFEENKFEVLKKIGAIESLNRGNEFGFAMANILARKAIDDVWDKDEALLYETLRQIEARYDCSDFMVAGLIRYLKKYSTDVKLEARAKDVLLNFRYWMNQTGSDAMCFWSENHSLLFYSAAMFCGDMYPDDYFTRAKMNGKELSNFGRANVEKWLEDVERDGFEEFLASVYVTITFVALLNLIDFGDDVISAKSTKITDELCLRLAKHTFDGVVIGPMGRVYKEVLYPFSQGAQGLINLINPSTPYGYSEGWIGMYPTSRYKFPKNLVNVMNSELTETYTTGNAKVILLKKKNYIMTSVQSPRLDKNFKRWENLTLSKKDKDISHQYTKSLNERFHGTTCFEPGIYGYQQHLWYGALDNETPVFVNHPGGSSDTTSLRPGYWFGNGIIPAIKQEGNIIASIYLISEEHPIHFTHAFWPNDRFEETISCNGWLFGRKKDGFIALWCSEKMELYQGQLFNCDYRTYGANQAYLCTCSDKAEFESFELFQKNCFQLNPNYDKKNKCLTYKNSTLVFNKSEDLTQFV